MQQRPLSLWCVQKCERWSSDRLHSFRTEALLKVPERARETGWWLYSLNSMARTSLAIGQQTNGYNLEKCFRTGMLRVLIIIA